MVILFIFIYHRQCAISSMHCSNHGKYMVCCVFCAAQRWLYCLFYLNDCLWYRVIFFVYIWFDSFQAYFDSFHSIRNSNHENHVKTNIEKELGRKRKEKKKKWKECKMTFIRSILSFFFPMIASSTFRPTNNKLLYKMILKIIINCDIED